MNYRNPNLGRIGSKKFLYIKLCVDIKETLDIKRNALDCFDSQKIRCGPLWIDSIVGRCSYRGYQMNTKYAEAFEVIKVSKW
jgi:hypothetical protein